jgi:hypothetical protein
MWRNADWISILRESCAEWLIRVPSDVQHAPFPIGNVLDHIRCVKLATMWPIPTGFASPNCGRLYDQFGGEIQAQATVGGEIGDRNLVLDIEGKKTETSPDRATPADGQLERQGRPRPEVSEASARLGHVQCPPGEEVSQ